MASKWPQRSSMASESNSVTSITYVPILPWTLNAAMSLFKRGRLSSLDLLASPQVKMRIDPWYMMFWDVKIANGNSWHWLPIFTLKVGPTWLLLVLKLDVNPQGSPLYFWHPKTSCNNDPYKFSMEDAPHDSDKLQDLCAPYTFVKIEISYLIHDFYFRPLAEWTKRQFWQPCKLFFWRGKKLFHSNTNEMAPVGDDKSVSLSPPRRWELFLVSGKK